MTHLLNLPDEVLCEILEYLSSFDVIYSFINLNIRFNRLVMPFKQHIDLTRLSHQHVMYYIYHLLPIVNQNERLYAIKLGNQRTPGQIDWFNQLIANKTYRDYFNTIDRVFIESPHFDELINFTNQFLLSLSKLETLAIKIDSVRDADFPEWTRVIVNSILSIPTLVKLSIEIPSGLVLARLSNTIMFNSLINATLNVSLVTDLLLFIQQTPNLESLSIRIGWWASGDRTLVKMLDEMRSNHHHGSFLKNLKKFHLTIDSIPTFQFEHLEQVLYRIMNTQTTHHFTFILRNYLNCKCDFITQLLDGHQWESLLSFYSALNQFNLFIRLTDSSKVGDEQYQIHSFQSKYFLEKKWFFSHLKCSRNDNIIFYSIPNRNKGLFDISFDRLDEFDYFPVNYTSNLLINQTSTDNCHLERPIFDFISNRFPSLQHLTLIEVDVHSTNINPLQIPSLHTLKLGKTRNFNLSKMLRLFPLINTLVISYFSIINDNSSFSVHQYDRIKELSLMDIPSGNLAQARLFLNQFPNLNFLHIHISNQRMTEEHLLINLNDIVHKFLSLICLKIQLEKDVNSSVNWTEQFNGRVKMYLIDSIFDGVLTHLWF